MIEMLVVLSALYGPPLGLAGCIYLVEAYEDYYSQKETSKKPKEASQKEASQKEASEVKTAPRVTLPETPKVTLPESTAEKQE
jgi:hypothetical protein